jgi:hypothetical protein
MVRFSILGLTDFMFIRFACGLFPKLGRLPGKHGDPLDRGLGES